VALVIIALYVIVTVMGGSVLKKVFYIGWIAEVVGIAVMWWLLATTSPAAFANLWNTTPVGVTLPYEKVIPLALANGYTVVPRNSWDATVASLPLAGLFWFGFYYMTMVGGEIKEVRKTIPLSIIAVFIATFIWWAVSAELYLSAFGVQWSYALAFLWERTSAYPGPTPTINLLLSIAAYPNVIIMAIVAVTFIITSFLMTFMNFFLPTRYLFAWAFDRVIPTRFADVSERFRSPVKATLLLAAFTVFGVFIFLYTNFGTVFTMSVMMMTISFFGPALAAIVFPFRQKDLFETLPSSLKAKIGGMPLLTIIGVLVTIGIGYLSYAFFLSPQVMTASTFGFEFIIGTFIFGLAVYFVSRAYWKGKGVAIDLAFKQLPPE
jgi:amino acid transporter